MTLTPGTLSNASSMDTLAVFSIKEGFNTSRETVTSLSGFWYLPLVTVAVFSTLLKLKNHHLAKLENRGRAVNLERIIEEIMGGIETFPAHLTMDEQGRFAIGYYHQRRDFFTKKDEFEKKEEE